MSWWLEGLNPKGLSQGDIVSQLLIGATDHPVKHLAKQPLEKAGKRLWEEVSELQPFKTDSRALYIARGRLTYAIVVSHSCELDKKNSNLVLLAPIAPLDRITDTNAKANILAQRRQAFLPLPDVPGLGTCYADFRTLSYVEMKTIPDNTRQVSMSDEGVLRLRAQIVAFFSRINPVVLETAIMDAIKSENAQG